MSKRNRDSSGKFIGDSPTTCDDPKIQTVTIWKKIKFAITILIVLLMSLPWGIIMVEPAKLYGMAIGESVSNFTIGIKDNFCGCAIRQTKPQF